MNCSIQRVNAHHPLQFPLWTRGAALREPNVLQPPLMDGEASLSPIRASLNNSNPAASPAARGKSTESQFSCAFSIHLSESLHLLLLGEPPWMKCWCWSTFAGSLLRLVYLHLTGQAHSHSFLLLACPVSCSLLDSSAGPSWLPCPWTVLGKVCSPSGLSHGQALATGWVHCLGVPLEAGHSQHGWWVILDSLSNQVERETNI